MGKVRQGFSLQQATRAQRGSRGTVLLFHDFGARWWCVVSITPQSPLPPGKTRYPLYRRLDGPQGRSGRVRKIPPPGFDPRTVQPVASLYADWAIPATWVLRKQSIFMLGTEGPRRWTLWTIFHVAVLFNLPACGARSIARNGLNISTRQTGSVLRT
jgi:hypothetical protein